MTIRDTNEAAERLQRILEDELPGFVEHVVEEYERLDPAFQATLPTADDVRGLLTPPCPDCGHPQGRHTRGGMCDGRGKGCDCVRIPPILDGVAS